MWQISPLDLIGIRSLKLMIFWWWFHHWKVVLTVGNQYKPMNCPLNLYSKSGPSWSIYHELIGRTYHNRNNNNYRTGACSPPRGASGSIHFFWVPLEIALAQTYSVEQGLTLQKARSTKSKKTQCNFLHVVWVMSRIWKTMLRSLRSY